MKRHSRAVLSWFRKRSRAERLMRIADHAVQELAHHRRIKEEIFDGLNVHQSLQAPKP